MYDHEDPYERFNYNKALILGLVTAVAALICFIISLIISGTPQADILSEKNTANAFDSGTFNDMTSSLNYFVYDYIDPETGVHYLVINCKTKENFAGITMVPRYDAKGNLMIENIKGE